MPPPVAIPANPNPGSNYSDDVVRAMIRAVIANPPDKNNQGHSTIKQSLIQKWGADGNGFPGNIPKSVDPTKVSVFPVGDTRTKEVANIVTLYLQSIGTIPQQPSQDPGEAIPSSAIPGPNIGSALDFLRLLTNPHTWVRVAEFGIGAILLAVGANAMLRQGMGSGAPQIRPPKTGFSYAKKALK